MKQLIRTALTATTWQRLDRRLVTDRAFRRAVIASGTGLSALCYLLMISAAR
jgi:hypothetical protein